MVDFIHITCERFLPKQGKEEKGCIDHLISELTKITPFRLFANQLVQFFAPYWDVEVLRWQVKETDEYSNLRKVLAAALHRFGCSPHFDLHIPTTCTALRLREEIDLRNQGTDESIPNPLFEANHLWISKLVRKNQFDILEKLSLKN